MVTLEQYIVSRQTLLPVDKLDGQEAQALQIISQLLTGPVNYLLEAIVQNPDKFRFILDDIDASNEKHGAKALVDYVQNAGWALVAQIKSECQGELTDDRKNYLNQKLQELTQYSDLLKRANSVAGLELLPSEKLSREIEETNGFVTSFLENATQGLTADNVGQETNGQGSEGGSIDGRIADWQGGIAKKAQEQVAYGDWVATVDSARDKLGLETLSEAQKELLKQIISFREYAQIITQLTTLISDRMNPDHQATMELLRNKSAREQVASRLLELSAKVQLHGRQYIDTLLTRYTVENQRYSSQEWLRSVNNDLGLESLRQLTDLLQNTNSTARLGFDEETIKQIASNLQFVRYAREKAGVDDQDLQSYPTPPPVDQ